jgi:hypothetical protein
MHDIRERPRIALIAWGSLVYDPGNLPLSSAWHADGPLLPVEFCRESRDGKITLVLMPGMPPVPTLWVTLAVENVAHARQLLADREARPNKGRKEIAGFWSPSEAAGTCAEEIGSWARAHDLTGAVWTALGPKFHGVDRRIPTVDEVVAHLRSLSGPQRRAAERYVRCAPVQIRTSYRAAIEDAVGWRPSS